MEPYTPATLPFDVATAIKETAKGHKQMSLLRAPAAVEQAGGAWPEDTEELFDGVMKSLAGAMPTLKPVAKRIPTRQLEGARTTETHNQRNEKPTRKRKATQMTKNKNFDLSRKRKRYPLTPPYEYRVFAEYSWTIRTSLPMNDAYQWRKYGEKKIHGAQFPRCYYRCAYREDEGCQAMKQVQRA